MDISIEVVIYHDKKRKKTGVLYEAFLVKDNKVLRQKPLLRKEDVLDVQIENNFENLTNNSFHSFVEELNQNNNIDNIELKIKPHFFFKNLKKLPLYKKITINKDFKGDDFENKLIKVSSNIIQTPTQSINENLNRNEKHSRFSHLKSPNRPNSFNTSDNKINATNKKEKSLNDFLNEKSNRKNISLNNLKNKIERKGLKEVFIDFGSCLHRERKRFAIMFDIFEKEEYIGQKNKETHRHLMIGHGEKRQCIRTEFNELKDILLFLKENGVKINLNIDPHDLCRSKNQELIKYAKDKNNNHAFNDVNVLTKETFFIKEVRKKSKNKLEEDINIYLKAIKDINNVAVFTDGSCNQSENSSGSGILIKHNNENYTITSNNKGTYEGKSVADSLYSEYKAILIAVQTISRNEKLKDKNVIIVSDNDSMAYAIKNVLKNRENGLPSYSPHLKQICDIIHNNNIKVSFHNVKSHVHENYNKMGDELFDFKYNKAADVLARKGAGIKLKESELKIIEDLNAIELEVPKPKRRRRNKKDSTSTKPN